ncbi:4726_t:CDS:10 [Entrophospora sp. SA101]|nr:4726_t:CDS:10 [Entrophospora sp. SA101]
MAAPKVATVKSVLSGNTLSLRGRPSNNQPPPERILSLAYIQAPRLGNQNKEDESFAFESREYLRQLVVGKEVTFRIDYSTPDNREFGSAFLGEDNITHLIVQEGWAKVREDSRKNKDESRGNEIEKLLKLEQDAQSAEKGIWKNSEPYFRNVNYTLSENPREYLNRYKGCPVDGIIEQVRDGSSLRVLCMPPSPAPQQYLNINISGIKAPIVRKDGTDVEPLVEPYGEEAKFFVESRLLQRSVKVILEGLSNNNQTFVATIIHPAGNIAEALVSVGLAKVVDWSIAFVTDGPTKLRAAENAAKEKHLRIWRDHVAKVKAVGDDYQFEGTVTRVISGDTIFVRNNRTGVEKKLQLSSIKQPKPKDTKFPEYNFEAKEFLRKKLIGKTVRVNIDYQKPAVDNFESRECATIKLGDFNPAEALLEQGLAHIIFHKRDDQDRSSCYDQLLIAEKKAQANTKGIHSNKDPPVYRIVDASETLPRARQFLHSLQRSGRVPGVVEFVYSCSRFKIYIPKESIKITFMLSGIRGPRIGHISNDHKSDPFAQEALDFATKKVLQRDVEIDVENIDKVGSFLGTLWFNKNDNFSVNLLEEGLATVHEYSADQSRHSQSLYNAEKIAKQAKKNIWSLQAPELTIEKENTAESEVKGPRKEIIDVVVSEIISGGHFYIQIDNDNIRSLEKMMESFSLYHKNAPNTPIQPKNGEIVSAQFTNDNQWYRAKIRKQLNESKSVEVVYIDYGNSETLPLSRIRSIPDDFKQLSAQSQEAVLSFLTVPEREKDYGIEACDRFHDLVGDKKLVANVDYRENQLLHLTLYDQQPSQQSDSSYSIETSINAEMVRDGFAFVNKKVRYARNNASSIKKLEELLEGTKKNRLGMFEYGDITE